MKRKQLGFTLIELIIVIVLLGILAAFALPRFANLQEQATVGVIEQVAGALKSTSAIFRSQALVEGVVDGQIIVDGNVVEMRGGYVKGEWAAWRNVLNLTQDIAATGTSAVCTVNDLCGVGNLSSAPGLLGTLTGGVSGAVIIWPKGYRINQFCYAYYINKETGEAPVFGTRTSGC